MKTIALILLAGAITSSLGAQAANVIPLSTDDSNALSKAWLDLEVAQAKWDKERERVGSKYVSTKFVCANGVYVGPQGVPFCQSVTVPKGFEEGFEFSYDFKFVVPSAKAKESK